MQLLWGIIKFIIIILSSLWVGVFVWTHQPLGRYVSLAVISVWVFFTLAVLVIIDFFCGGGDCHCMLFFDVS